MKVVGAFVAVSAVSVAAAYGFANNVKHDVAAADKDALHAEKARQTAAYTEVCLRNNITKAVLRVNETRRLELVRDLARGHNATAVRMAAQGAREVNDLLPILDCKATFAAAVHGVLLPAPIERRYLAIIRKGYVPELRGDRIVGQHRAETNGSADF